MRNTWLIIKREYLERVRTRSFVVLTLLTPAIMTALMVLPAKLATMGDKVQHIVVVTSTPQFGEMVRQELLSASTAGSGNDEEAAGSQSGAAKQRSEKQYVIDLDPNPTEAERAALRDKVNSKAIDGYLWLSDDAIAAGKIAFATRSMGNSGERSRLSEKLTRILEYARLSQNGVSGEQADLVLKPVNVEAIRIEEGRETKDSSGKRFLEVIVMVMLIYVAVLLYGISVMRSVLEEKNSRVMEVLLSSATSTELMIGKIFGVGAVGVTQIAVWAVMAGVLAFPSLAMNVDLSQLRVSPGVLVAFVTFFLLGYLLFSALYAAIGAITTTEQEGQQLQFIVVIPLVLSVFMLSSVVRTPDSPAVIWLSMVPFFAPVLMYARIVIQTPPVWQIVLCLSLLIATIAGLLVLCARIYRVGVLIYGKRPTLPEILKWLKYAKT
ncbi:MAG: ABC transporter permease [Terriglobales bacterium]|jgi:ABC-2 type transport system permease protein